MHNDNAALPACCFQGPKTQNTEICLSVCLFLSGIGIELGTNSKVNNAELELVSKALPAS
jgi:hypothetical protein